MRSDQDAEVLTSVGGDPEAARLLRANLTSARDHLRTGGADSDLLEDLEAVLAGRLQLRGLMLHDAFRELIEEGMQRVVEEWNSLSPDERAVVVRESQPDERLRRP